MFIRDRNCHTITISRLVKVTGLTSRTFRFYEEIGLIRSIPRLNHKAKRVFPKGVIFLIQQIRLFKRTGLKLKVIKERLNINDKEYIKILKEQDLNLKYEILNIQANKREPK